MRAREKISVALAASQFTPEQAEQLSGELYSAVARELAQGVRDARIPSPVDETEEHVNAVLDDLARSIGETRG